MKFEWNLPNALTLFRFVLVPAIVACIVLDSAPSLLIALLLFGLSALTDALDGAIARKQNLTSEFGAYIDPLADKILVSAVYIVLVLKTGLYVFWWMVTLIIARDVLVTWLRRRSRVLGITFKTSFLAKAKTATQMIALALILIYMTAVRYAAGPASMIESYALALEKLIPGTPLVYLPLILTSIVTLFTIYTAIDYTAAFLKKSREK